MRYLVQYEELHVIYPQCGCYGHVLKECDTPQQAPQLNAIISSTIEEDFVEINSDKGKHTQEDENS